MKNVTRARSYFADIYDYDAFVDLHDPYVTDLASAVNTLKDIERSGLAPLLRRVLNRKYGMKAAERRLLASDQDRERSVRTSIILALLGLAGSCSLVSMGGRALRYGIESWRGVAVLNRKSITGGVPT